MMSDLDGLEITFKHRGLLKHADRDHDGRIPLSVARQYTGHQQSRRDVLADLQRLGYVDNDDNGFFITDEAYRNLEFLSPDRIGNQSLIGEY